MKISLKCLGRLAGFGGALVLSAHALAVTYTVTDLGNAHLVNGFQSKVLNDQGEVIANDIGPDGRAFLYSGGTWTDLGHLNTSGSGSSATLARGINNLGLVAGQTDTGLTNANDLEQSEGFFRNGVGGTFTPLGLVSAMNVDGNAIAYGCNNLGMIVGNVFDLGTGVRDTFIFVPGTGVTSRTSDGVYSFSINDFGDVLGIQSGLVSQTVVNGVAISSKLAGFAPHAINNAGQILLSCDDVHPLPLGWGAVYDYGTGKSVALPNLKPNSAGYTTFMDLNDAGAVVGRGSDENLTPHAVLWTPADGMISLDDLGLTDGVNPVHLTEAHGINNAGQIVCLGYTTDANDVHTYLLTPDANPPKPLAAAYDGLASVGGANLGTITVAISKKDVATVKLNAPGVSHSFKVTLVGDTFTGQATSKKTTLNVSLTADAAHEKVTGTIDDGTNTYAVTALRQVKLGIFAGKFTALLQLAAPMPGLPEGIGWGKMTVSKTGAVKITGQLGDGSKYSAGGLLHYDGSWTFYAPLYTKSVPPGGIAGLMTFNRAATDSDASGTLRWNKPGDFLTEATCKAARYVPGKNQQVLNFTNKTAGAAAFALAGGEQTIAPHTLSVSEKNVVTVTDPGADNLAVKIAAASGALSGSFVHPVTLKPTKFVGVVQQKLNIAAGVFVGPTTSGSVLLTPQ